MAELSETMIQTMAVCDTSAAMVEDALPITMGDVGNLARMYLKLKAKLPADAIPSEPQERIPEGCQQIDYSDPSQRQWNALTGNTLIPKRGAAPTAAGSEEPKSQGLCDTTMTERFENKDCVCNTYPGNLGPCSKFEDGSNARCVFCDHELSCHLAVGKRKFEAVMADPVAPQAPASKQPEPNWMLMVDEVCCEYGPPEYRMTEDGEALYWCFPGHELPVADNLSELLLAGAQLMARNHVKAEANHE